MSLIVPHVCTYAVQDRIICGITAKGYFILDLRESTRATPKEFILRDDWTGELTRLGVPADIELHDPDKEAATRPPKDLYPWAYKYFGGPLGLSDSALAVDLVLAAMAFSAVLGLAFGKIPFLGILPLLAGAGAGLALQTVGDSPCCSGVIFYAPVCYGCYRLTAAFRGPSKKGNGDAYPKQADGSGGPANQ